MLRLSILSAILVLSSGILKSQTISTVNKQVGNENVQMNKKNNPVIPEGNRGYAENGNIADTRRMVSINRPITKNIESKNIESNRKGISNKAGNKSTIIKHPKRIPDSKLIVHYPNKNN